MPGNQLLMVDLQAGGRRFGPGWLHREVPDRVGVGSGLLAFGDVQAPVGAKGGPCDQDASCGLRESDGGRAPSAGAECLDGEG
jgi:hypothetical protein